MPVFKLMFCWSLRSGTLGIGSLGLGTLIIGLIAAIAELNHNHSVIEGRKADFEEVFSLLTINVYIKYILSIIVISIITHIMLILGAASNKKHFMIPWLFVTMIMAISSFVAVINYGCKEMDPGQDAAIYIFGLLFSVLYVYLWLCVLSFFQELQEEEGEEVKDEDIIALITADNNLPPPYTETEATG